ncbi:RHS repeat-associated core domain-containing protein [Variovorax sp. J22P271]|uniref:RHS repeat domain-containing protein n=1 Tax=Variovorax davisae TaxID=3053515 RepID=UPI002577989B|nr:RHS repeat-associated core domain-containing protein [Variovorax sp. J22P271]MDM0037171.1 RHS repeat-associated core domain-containing protein [Variovorax sp. J22P271]
MKAQAQEWGLLRTVPTPTSSLLDNLLRRFGDTRYEHDERGNLHQAHIPGQRSQVFEWDGFGRLRRFETLHDSEVRYFYDPLGRRIGKKSGAVVLPNSSAGSGWRPAEIARINSERGYGMTTFGWDGDALAWERSAGKLIHYLYEPGASFVPMVQLRREAQGNQWGPQRLAWYQCDHLGTPMELTDDKGKIVWEGDYKAFGKAKATSFDGFTNNIRFQGQYFDEETGLHYNRYRYYDPIGGRYVSKDPIGLAGGLDKYLFADGNPTKNIDPRGLMTFMCTQPLHALGTVGEWVYAPKSNPLHHKFIAIIQPNGSVVTGGQDRVGKPWSEGKPSEGDGTHGNQQCEKVEEDNQCLEQCLLPKMFSTTRPKYALIPGTFNGGENCQSWADQTVEECRKVCNTR